MALKVQASLYRRIRGGARRQYLSELVLRRLLVVILALLMGSASFFGINHPTGAVAYDWYINGWDKLSNGGTTMCGMSGNNGYCWGALGVNGNPGIHPSPVMLRMTGELAGKTLTDIQTRGTYACALASGKIYCWGYSNAAGQMGRGESQYSTTVDPSAVDMSGALNGKVITSMSLGEDYMCALADGRAYCWGDNSSGQLGNGTNDNALYPVAVDMSGALQNKYIDAIYAGGFNTCAIAEGKAYCWGYQAYGGNGDGTTTSRNSPVAVDTSGVLNGKTVSSISMGQSSACALANGSVYCWGSNFVGNLGDGTTTSRNSPVAVDTSGVLNGKTVDNVYGGSSVCATADGQAYCWGDNASGQLGDGTTTSRNSPVAVDTSGVLAGKTVTESYGSGNSSCALADRIGYCWGSNQYGQSGSGSNLNDSLYPQQIVMPSTRIDSVQSASMLINAPDDSYVLILQGQDLQYAVSAKIGGEPIDILPITNEFVEAGAQLLLRPPLKTQPGDYNVAIELTNPDGQTTTYQTTLTYKKDAPTGSFASPDNSYIENPSATSTIIGDNFTKNTEVYVGGKKATIIGLSTSGVGIQIPPSSVTGKVSIEIRTENGQVTLPDAYEYKSKYPSYGLLPNKYLRSFGSQGSGDGQLSGAQNVIVDKANGDMYVSDSDNHRVVVYDDNGNYVRQFGTQGTNDDQFNWISAMRFGKDGNLYVLDSNASKVKVFRKDGSFVKAFSGPGIEEGQINYAEAMEIDSTGNVYIPQCGWDSQAGKAIASVEVFNPDGTFMRRFEKSEPAGNDSCLYAITISSSGDIYVYDDMWSQGQNANRILVFGADGQYKRQFGTVGNGKDQFSFVEDMAIDKYGNILVLDSDNNRLQIYDKNEKYVGQIGVEGSGSGEFENPRSVTVNDRNEIIILDSNNNRVQVFEGMTPSPAPSSSPVSEPGKKVPVPTHVHDASTQKGPAAGEQMDKSVLEQSLTTDGNTQLANNVLISKRPTFSGIAAPFAEVIVTVHSDPVVCKTTADAEGKWSCTLPSDLPAGRHHVTIELTKQDGTKTTLGPYAVRVKGGDTVTSNTPTIQKQTQLKKNSESKPSYALAVALGSTVIVVLAGLGLVLHKRRSKA